MTPTNRIRSMVVIETEDAQISATQNGLMTFIRPIFGNDEVAIVFNRVNAARVLRKWADTVERLEK